MKAILRILMTVAITMMAQIASAQLDLGNEEIVYSFKTAKGKSVVLCLNLDRDYIVYRYGTDEKVELEFPLHKNESSFQQFKYYYLFRGGGPGNEGMDLNYIVFRSGNFKYIIYDEITTDNSQCGIKGVNLTTGKETDIKGVFKTRTGTLTDFRTNELLDVIESTP